LIVGMKNQTTPNRNVEMTPTMASGSDNWVTNREEEEVKEASGSDNWVSDRVDGKPEEPVLAEVPRLASKNADLFYGKKKAAPVPVAPAAPAKPSADITQLSSDTLAKMQKALAGSEDLMNDKAAQAFIAAIAEELMNRPVEVEQEQPAAPAAGAVAPPAPMPIAASFTALAFAGFEDEEEEIENPECPACGGPGMFLGQLGNLAHFTCRNCGMQFSQDGDGHDSHMAADRRKDFFKDDMKKKVVPS
jgi:ribosomal protein S27AE